MTKINNTSVREFLEETYRPRSEERSDLATLQESNHRLLEEERRKDRRFMTWACVAATLVISILLGLSINENLHLTDAQRAHLEYFFN